MGPFRIMMCSIFTNAGLCLAEQFAKHLRGSSQQNPVEKGRDREHCNSPTERKLVAMLSLSPSALLQPLHCGSTVFCLAKPPWNHKAEQPVGELSCTQRGLHARATRRWEPTIYFPLYATVLGSVQNCQFDNLSMCNIAHLCPKSYTKKT